MKQTIIWSDSDDALLRKLREEGQSSQKLAERFRRSQGFIARRLHTLGVMKKRGRPSKPKVVKPHTPRFYDRQIVVPDFATTPVGTKMEELAVFTQDESITVMESGPFQCRWPIGDGLREPRCCGSPIASRSYCTKHAQRAHGPNK